VYQPSILFINRVFPPDHGATGRCLADLATRFAAEGWRVTVLADGAAGMHDDPAHFTVVRAGPSGNSAPARAIDYVMALLRLYAAAVKLPRHDVVVTMTDPPLLACIGPFLRIRRSCVLIHWSQDLYPDLFPIVGVNLPQFVTAALDAFAGAVLRRYDAVIAIGACMAQRIALKGVGPERVEVVPNWADPVIQQVPRETNPMRRELGLGDRFTVAYSGNFGLAHPLEAVIDAATTLAREAPEIMFLLIGQGRGLDRVRREIADRALPNLRLLPWQPAWRLSESLGAADLHLASMDGRAEGMLIPSKVAGALAAGRPCILLGPTNSAAARLIVGSGCGSVLPSGDGQGLARAIMLHASDPLMHAQACARASAAASAWSADQAAGAFIAKAASAIRPPVRRRTLRWVAGRSAAPKPQAPFIAGGKD
jgi:colanic acid biosynthesis glycosyl transferase WcaI